MQLSWLIFLFYVSSYVCNGIVVPHQKAPSFQGSRSAASSAPNSVPYVIESGTVSFRNQHPTAFEVARSIQSIDQIASKKAPLLLLNGFGVGSFHQHKLIHELLQDERNHGRLIYGMDYLGQGRSWPVDCQDGEGISERGLRYCGETWMEQIIHFIEEIILKEDSQQEASTTKVHIVGNSVGGHLAVCLAAARPDLVESLCLLNATPVWGLNLPGWSGHLPAPWFPKQVGRFLFDQIRDINTIETYLKSAYVNHDAFDNKLVQQIRDCTMGTGGHAAFASIMWSPPVSVMLRTNDDDQNVLSRASFEDCLQALKCSVLLCFGRDDPWCKPAFAKRMLQRLQERSCFACVDQQLHHRFVELSQVGHCPNHEAPRATAHVVTNWLDGPHLPLLTSKERSMAVSEDWGVTHLEERLEHEIHMSWADELAVRFVS